MSHVLPNISRGRFFEPIFTSKKFDLYTSIYGKLSTTVCLTYQGALRNGGCNSRSGSMTFFIQDSPLALDWYVRVSLERKLRLYLIVC